MEGKTAAEKAAADPTAEQEAPGWMDSIGAGAAWSAVKGLTEGGGHGHSHGHSHGGVACDGNHGPPPANGHVAAPAPAPPALMGDVAGFMQASQRGGENLLGETLFEQFIRACTSGDKPDAERVYELKLKEVAKEAKEEVDAAQGAAAMLNEECGIGYAALHLACYHGHLEVVEWLLSLPGIDIEASTHDEMYKLGATGLHLAVAAGSLEIVFYMVTNGYAPHIDVRDNRKCTPLIIAAQYGEVVISHFLMRNGADPRAVDQHGDTAMHWAAYKGHSDLVSLYAVGAISVGCEVPINQKDNFGQSALHLAALRGNADTVKTLTGLGAEKELPDEKGKTPRDLAVEKQDLRDHLRTRGQHEILYLLEEVKDVASLQRWWIHSGLNTYYMKMAMVVHTTYAYFGIVLWSGVVPATDVLLQTILFFGLVFFWQMVHRVDPGSLPDSAKVEYEGAIAEMCETGVNFYTRANGRKLCHTCREVRPLRAKYDRYLRKNVPRFDHHCPWVGNTVGLQNQVYFYTYTFFCLVCCNYWAFPYIGLAHRWTSFGGEGHQWSYNVFISSCYHTFSSMFGIAMWTSHTFLASKNMTTNENINMHRFPHFQDAYTGEIRNPFDKGMAGNFAAYFARESGDEPEPAGGPGTKTLDQMRAEVNGNVTEMAA